MVTAGTLESLLLQFPIYVPPEVIRIAVGSVVDETSTDADVLLPSQIAVTEEEPMPIPANSPFPFGERMVVSPVCHVQSEGEIATAPLAGTNLTLSPCLRFTVAGESCIAPG